MTAPRWIIEAIEESLGSAPSFGEVDHLAAALIERLPLEAMTDAFLALPFPDGGGSLHEEAVKAIGRIAHAMADLEADLAPTADLIADRAAKQLVAAETSAQLAFQAAVDATAKATSEIVQDKDETLEAFTDRALEFTSPGPEPCLHLADSDQPGANLMPEPCPNCGRYYVNDDNSIEEPRAAVATEQPPAVTTDLESIRKRVTLLTIAAGLPKDIRSELCLIDDALRALLSSAPVDDAITDEQILRWGQSKHDGTVTDAMARHLCTIALGLGDPATPPGDVKAARERIAAAIAEGRAAGRR